MRKKVSAKDLLSGAETTEELQSAEPLEAADLPQDGTRDPLPNVIPLESLQVAQAFRFAGKVTNYYHHIKSEVRGLKMSFVPAKHCIVMTAPGFKPILVPTANIPFMTPLES